MIEGEQYRTMEYEFTEGFYHRLGEASDMSVESVGSLQTSNGGGSVSMSIMDSSVGSNNSRTTILMHPDLRTRTRTHGGSVAHSVANNNIAAHTLGEDVLAQALMDDRYPTDGLEEYDEWTIDLRKLNMGPPFAQGAFGKLYKGTYNNEDVAVKILERPENNIEKAQILEQQFTQEVKMLATLRHQNVVRFIGACKKPMVWCIVTEYAKGGSVRQSLAKRQNRPVPLKLAVKQALDVARGMEYLQSLGFIHRDLKSDNLLIATDKSIKIAPILLSSFHPFPTLSFSLPSSTPLASLPHIFSPLLPVDAQVLSTRSGRSIGPSTAGVLSSFNSDPHACFIELRLVPKVLGGKGGFGSQLRAAGGRMSSQKTQNNDSCRDLTGRRLSTIKEAKKLAAAIASEPERQAAQRRAAETKLAELNKEVVRLDALVNGTDEGNVRKRRLDDSKDLEQSREGLDKLKGAVAIAMAKKKKAKLAAASKAGPSEKKPELKVIDEGGEGSPSAPAQDFNAAQVDAETIGVPTPSEDTKPLQPADSLDLNSAIIEVVDAVPTSSPDDTSSSPKPTTQ